MNTHFWKNILLICAGVVIGSLISSLTSGIKFLSWLSYGMSFGTQQPVTLDLGVLQLTFGLNIDITVAVIIAVVIIYTFGRKILR
ncbi:MAG: DUF4321 domain-containing protein [Clostridia bacterium]|nr:DUF4321 domain-containing protein [Clostridia bacterium]